MAGKIKKKSQKRKRRSKVVVVTGSRNWTDRKTVEKHLIKLDRDTLLIHGGERGLDSIAASIWQDWGLAAFCCDALWDFYQLAAGPIRNSWMLALMPDKVLAFHENLKKSKGTKDCVKKAKALGIPVKIIKGP